MYDIDQTSLPTQVEVGGILTWRENLFWKQNFSIKMSPRVDPMKFLNLRKLPIRDQEVCWSSRQRSLRLIQQSQFEPCCNLSSY